MSCSPHQDPGAFRYNSYLSRMPGNRGHHGTRSGYILYLSGVAERRPSGSTAHGPHARRPQ